MIAVDFGDRSNILVQSVVAWQTRDLVLRGLADAGAGRLADVSDDAAAFAFEIR